MKSFPGNNNRSTPGFSRGLLANGNQTPFASDAFEIWNYRESEIITDGGNKYFKGQNGHNLLITGYDFDAGFQKGFLYKSAATVSAPVGDAEFIAADVNGFFYTAGTPNQIPVISFFQNVDYAGKLFNRHYDQTVNELGVETYEPRVWQTVLYNTVKTGAELEKCNNYFKVPVEDANAKWVDFVNGVDTNDGTKANPWKTYSKAITTVASGATVYVKSFNAINEQIYVNKPLTVKALGFCKSIFSTNFGISLTGNNINISGFVLSGNYRKLYYSTTGTVTAEKMYCYTDANYTVYLRGTAASANLTLKNSVIVGKINYDVATVNIEGCLINGEGRRTIYNLTPAANTNTLTVKHNKINIPQNVQVSLEYTIYSGSNNLIIHNNKVTSVNSEGLYTNLLSVNNVEVTYNEYNGGNGYRPLSAFITAAFKKCIGNKVKFTGQNPLIQLSSTDLPFSQVDVNNNIHDALDAASIEIGGVNANVNTLNINNNVFMTRQAANDDVVTGLGIGKLDQTYRNYQLNVKNNLFLSPKFWGSSYGGHASMFILNVKNVNISNNNMRGSGLYSIVYKSDVIGFVSESSLILGNLVRDAGICLKNIDNADIYNNTLHDSNVVLDEQSTGLICKNISIKNNIINTKVDGACILAIKASEIVSNNNLFYNGYTGPLAFSFNGAKSLSEWTSLGYDANSLNQNPNLNANLIPAPPISIGENLGATYEDGLDVSTNWGSASQIPNVITKKQPTVGAWQVGAYVQ